MTSELNVIFFDGYCGLCNGFVDFIMKIDKKRVFRFSPLQSEYARQHLPAEFVTDLKSVIVQVEGRNLRKTEAVLAVFKLIGPPWSLLVIGRILPPRLLNVFYDMVAENRYQLFGKRDSCRLPTPEERALFIL
jgi:predicted DCC family thiol-disulfide oxidoreductase YuxK